MAKPNMLGIRKGEDTEILYEDENGVKHNLGIHPKHVCEEMICNLKYLKPTWELLVQRDTEYKELVEAFLDLIDGEDERDIHRNTGLPEPRCQEIYDLYRRLLSQK